MAVAAVDLSRLDHAGPAEREGILRTFAESCASRGLVKVTGHGIPKARLNELFRWFFDFPDAVKRTAPRPRKGPNRGYIAVGGEKLSGISGYMKGIRNPVVCNDVKESFDAGPAYDKVHPTPWPVGPRCQEFRHFMEDFLEDCLMVHHDLLHLLEEALGLNHQELTLRCSAGNGVVRITHYPPMPAAQLRTGSTYRISEHTDVGILTLLFQDSVGGLEVERQDNSAEFVPVESFCVNEMIVNCGDTLQRWTANYLRSANHRVTYPQGLGGK
ncbi:hypothetical protein N7539_004688 [Penicillium diatomitis]|uniref:Fe2OG dioxygenase domain-containing protein n=1 Tax=Penicillium diatomitis TaxID=2819901 RepID=A0A9W9X5I2_9EURO|nr:uncharacterized protein N7539_004688 [Penicillium diatomitis]KAJ5484700.1 hypothetical protein N7539_004688 [Penicillium diatomitis]